MEASLFPDLEDVREDVRLNKDNILLRFGGLDTPRSSSSIGSGSAVRGPVPKVRVGSGSAFLCEAFFQRCVLGLDGASREEEEELRRCGSSSL